MTRLMMKTTAFALAAIGLVSAWTPAAEARISSNDTFTATYSQMKRICKRYDHSIWKTKSYYGCGPTKCDSETNKCKSSFVPPPKKHPNCPPTIACVAGKNSDGGQEHGGKKGGGTANNGPAAGKP